MPKQFVFMKDLNIAQLRWELLRRNEQYLAAYKDFLARHPRYHEEMQYLLPDSFRRAFKDAQHFQRQWGCGPANPILKLSPFLQIAYDPSEIIPVYHEKKKIIQFDIPIATPSEAILRWVRYWVGHFKRNASERKTLTRKRIEDIKLALKVFDLKRTGKKYLEISGQLNLDPSFRGTGTERAKNLFETAKTWIRRAAVPNLWIDAPWIFDSIIVQHQRGANPDPASRKDSPGPPHRTYGSKGKKAKKARKA